MIPGDSAGDAAPARENERAPDSDPDMEPDVIGNDGLDANPLDDVDMLSTFRRGAPIELDAERPSGLTRDGRPLSGAVALDPSWPPKSGEGTSKDVGLATSG